MIIARKYWSPTYRKVALGFKAKSRFAVVIASNDGIVVRHNFGRREGR